MSVIEAQKLLGSVMPEEVCLVNPHYAQPHWATKPRSCHSSLCLDPKEKKGWSCDPLNHSSVPDLLCPELRMQVFVQAKLSLLDLLLNSDTKIHTWKPIFFRQKLISENLSLLQWIRPKSNILRRSVFKKNFSILLIQREVSFLKSNFNYISV